MSIAMGNTFAEALIAYHVKHEEHVKHMMHGLARESCGGIPRTLGTFSMVFISFLYYFLNVFLFFSIFIKIKETLL